MEARRIIPERRKEDRSARPTLLVQVLLRNPRGEPQDTPPRRMPVVRRPVFNPEEQDNGTASSAL